jgi:hypothetical protein
MRFSALALAVAFGLPAIARAQGTPDTLSLLGKSTISFGFGLTGARTTTTNFAQTSTHTTGQVGDIAFSHWVRPTVAVEISVAALNADETTAGSRVHSNVITPILFGVSVSPRALALSSSVRPYVSLAAGPYIHTVSDVYAGSSNASVETVPGARVAAGANWFVSRHFLLAVETNYHAVGKFDTPDALTEKPSGFGMTLSFGFAWGGR